MVTLMGRLGSFLAGSFEKPIASWVGKTEMGIMGASGLSLLGAICGPAFAKGHHDKRGFEVSDALIQLDASKMHVRDLHHLSNGIHINATGMAEGTAMFSAKEGKGFGEVEGTISYAPPHNGLLSGNLSFAIPGLENEVHGQWIAVSPTRHGEEEEHVAQRFSEMYGTMDAHGKAAREAAEKLTNLMQG